MKKFFQAFKDTLLTPEGLGAVAAIVVAIGVLMLFRAGPDRVAAELQSAKSRFLPAA